MPRPPDIIWILTTQWRGQAMGFVGDPNAWTPAIDAFVEEAEVFADAITPHPFGPFARAALLTGAPSPENGIRDYYDPLPHSARTIAHKLGELGYETGFMGKWHLSQRDPSVPLVGEAHARQLVAPEDRGGFEFWEGFESGFLLNDPWLHGTRLPAPTQFTGYQSDVLCERAGTYLSERIATPDRPPLFFVLSLEAPHPPYHAPAAGVVARAADDMVLPGNVPLGSECEAKARYELSGYYAHIQATDRAIGRMLSKTLLNEAIVVFTSVHGDMHGSHGLFRKGWPYEESVRVPLIVRLPENRIPENRVPLSEVQDKAPRSATAVTIGSGSAVAAVADRSTVPSADQWPTSRLDHWRTQTGKPVSLLALHRWTLEWAGDKQNGTDLVTPGGESAVLCSMPSVVNLPQQCDRAWKAVRTARRKLVVDPEGKPWLYFDLERDPLELKNLVDSPAHSGEIAGLRALLQPTA